MGIAQNSTHSHRFRAYNTMTDDRMNHMLLRMYSHQESPLVPLLWSGPNTKFIFLVTLYNKVSFININECINY